MKRSVISIATLVLTGCGALADLNIQNPRYTLRDIRPRVQIALPLSASTIDFDYTIGIDNPNPVGLRLDQLDFNLYVNDNRIFTGVSNRRISIPANGVGDLQLHSRVGYQDLRALWNEVVDVIQGNRARYELRGTAYYNTPIGRLRFPVTVYASR